MFCENCGKKLSGEARFCSDCGKPVNGEFNKDTNVKAGVEASQESQKTVYVEANKVVEEIVNKIEKSNKLLIIAAIIGLALGEIIVALLGF